jgi:MFS transporter, Spinster family, sphingosine-1-phosphate transporter
MGRWGALGILMTLAFLNYLDRNLIFPLLGLISRDIGVSTAELGAVATGFHVVYAVSAPLLGLVSDRLPRKLILLVALVSWSFVTALSGTATGFVSLLLFRAATGLGEGGYFPTAVSLIGDLFGPSERGLAIALHGICATLGGSAGYAVGGFLGERLGWRVPFFLAVVPGLGLALLLGLRFREPPRGQAAPASGGPREVDEAPVKRRPYHRIVLAPTVIGIALTACCAMFAMNGLNTYLPLYLEKERGVSVSTAGVLTGAFFSATLVGQLAGGVLSDRLSRRVAGVRPLLVALPYLAVAPAVLAIPHTNAILIALACYGFTQIGRGFAEPNIYGTIIDGTPAHERGSAQGFLLMLTFVGASASPWLAGVLIEKSGYATALHVLGCASAVAGALAFGLFAHIRRPHRLD